MYKKGPNYMNQCNDIDIDKDQVKTGWLTSLMYLTVWFVY